MRRRSLSVESLESRQMLAGNVTAQLVSGDLVISGDNAANIVSIESAGVGVVQVHGFGTQINGTANGTALFQNFNGGITIRSRGGDDLVRVTNLILPGHLTIDLGIGRDEAVMGHDRAGGNSRFANSATGHLAVYGDFRFLGGDGNDLLQQSYVHFKKVGVINLGAGNDVLRMQYTAGENLDVKYRGLLSIYTGTGDDIVSLRGLVCEFGMNLVDEGGEDFVYLKNLDVQGRFFANLGDGDDTLELLIARAETLSVRAGEGADELRVRSTTAADAFFYGEGGIDLFVDSLTLRNQFTRFGRNSIEQIQHL